MNRVAGAEGAPADVDARIAEVASRVFGWRELRAGQEEAIAAVVAGSDVLAVMATGHGKSAIYQIAGHLLDGPTVVVSPLISLQRDQIAHILESTGLAEAVAVNSSQSAAQNGAAWESVSSGEAEFIFLAPEQLARAEVVDRLSGLGVSLVVVDEAHSVSAWGHDFRPDYLRLGDVIARLGGPRILALTATGPAPVREEIVRRLGMRDPVLFVRGFDRPNVHLAVVRHESEADKDREVRRQVAAEPGPGLVYVATHAHAERLAAELTTEGLRAAAYHGGLPAARRRDVHDRFRADAVDVVVATSAFGMGIDKPDVRFVVHADITDSIDSYYQEVGRAGRDDARASATLHYRQSDLGLRRFFATKRPSGHEVVAAVRVLADAPDGRRLPVEAIATAAGLSVHTTQNLLGLLIDGGIAADRDGGVALLRPIAPEDALAVVAETAESRLEVDESRLAMIRTYAETLRCRRQVLLGYFGEDLAEPCGNCDTCDRGTAYTYHHGASGAAALPTDAGRFQESQRVVHARWGAGEVVSVEADRLTVYFESRGYRVLSLADVERWSLLTVVDAPPAP